jgi:hypothetical protein
MAMRAYAIPSTGADRRPDASVQPSGPQDQEGAGETSNRRPKRRMLLGVGGALLILAVAAAALTAASTDKETIKGTFTLFASDDVSGDMSECEGTGGYDDVSEGVPVTIRDQEDNIVGSATLANASADEIASRIAARDEDATLAEAQALVERMDGVACVLVFDAEVDDAEFYDIEVGERGKISYSRKELIGNGWTAAFTLGD